MLFRQLFDRESCSYTYLLASRMGGDAIIIDPVKNNLSQYIMLIKQLNLNLLVAMDTHLHADHITALSALRHHFHCHIMMGEQAQVLGLTHTFADGEVLDVDGLSIKALHTPGHTDDSYCFLMSDRVFTGDTLFIRGTGRTDFQTGSAHLQYESLFNCLLCLPDETLVYPGHDYQGMTVSTIGEEKKYNPRLKVTSVEDYEVLMGQLNLPPPKMMHIAVPHNLNCGNLNDQTIAGFAADA